MPEGIKTVVDSGVKGRTNSFFQKDPREPSRPDLEYTVHRQRVAPYVGPETADGFVDSDK